MTIIYVVSFAPATDFNGVGGFEWSTSREDAEKVFERYAAESQEDGGHIVRLLEVETDKLGAEDISEWIDAEYLDEIELRLDPIRQFIPEGTDADRLPDKKGNF